jgi:hypothetical protein
MLKKSAAKKRPEKISRSKSVGSEYISFVEKTQTILQGLQNRIKSPLIAFWTSSGGSICHDDVIVFSHLLADMPKTKTLTLFLKSQGGNPEAALRLVHLLRNQFEKIILLAPFECASAATMIALGANEIHMGTTSFLTAVDTSLKHDLSPVDHNNYLVSVSQDEVSRILRLWKAQASDQNPFPEVYKYLHPLVIGALDRSSSLSIRICEELLSYHMNDTKKIRRISRELNSQYPSHSYPITAREAIRLGLNIKRLQPEIETALRDLNFTYSQMAKEKRKDTDAQNHHVSEVCNIVESVGRQIHYLVDKDWHYRKEERRWVSINDRSTWLSISRTDANKWQRRPLHIC